MFDLYKLLVPKRETKLIKSFVISPASIAHVTAPLFAVQ